MINRLGIFVFFDVSGVVDKYIEYFLDDYIQNFSEFVIVCNGKLNKKGKEIFSRYTKNIIVRSNEGLDTWAYKEGMDYYGWDKLSEYDEVVLCNDTIFGPIGTFKTMFDEMADRDIDFWGITRHSKLQIDAFDNNLDYVPEHIQSYFMAFKKRFIQSKDFQSYWDNIPMINSYSDAVGKHEVYFTKYFSDLGYKWETYVKTEDLDKYSYQPLMAFSYEIVKNRKCPIFKKRLFFQDYKWFMDNGTEDEPLKLYSYLKDEKLYPMELVQDNLMRTRSLDDIARTLNLNYELDLTRDASKEESISDAVIIINVDSFVAIDILKKRIAKLSSSIDIIIYTNKEFEKEVNRIIGENSLITKKVFVLEDRNADTVLNKLLFSNCDLISKYKYICIVQNLIDEEVIPLTTELKRNINIYDNIIPSVDYIKNTIKIFEENKNIGVLRTVDCIKESRINVKEVKEYLAKYKINIDINIANNILPYSIGEAFWLRTEAIYPLLDYAKIISGNDIYVLDRIMSANMQNNRYYPANLINKEVLRNQIISDLYVADNKHDSLDKISISDTNKLLIQNEGYAIIAMDNVPKNRNIMTLNKRIGVFDGFDVRFYEKSNEYMKGISGKTSYIYQVIEKSCTDKFLEEFNIEKIRVFHGNNGAVTEDGSYTVPIEFEKCNELAIDITDNEKIIRIDPLDFPGLVEVDYLYANMKDGSSKKVKIKRSNATLYKNNIFLFTHEDAQLYIKVSNKMKRINIGLKYYYKFSEEYYSKLNVILKKNRGLWI